jgi:hypothetical protein
MSGGVGPVRPRATIQLGFPPLADNRKRQPDARQGRAGTLTAAREAHARQRARVCSRDFETCANPKGAGFEFTTGGNNK